MKKGIKNKSITLCNQITLLILLFIASLNLSSCYTITKQVDSNKVFYETSLKFPVNSKLDDALVGEWVNKRMWMDYGFQYRRLEIKKRGVILYIPNSERVNSEIYYGDYRVISDTLMLDFDGKFEIEWMTYKISNDTLYLLNIKELNGKEQKLVNNSYNNIQSWVNINKLK